MPSIQAGPTDSEFRSIPPFKEEIGYFRSRLIWSEGTSIGDFIPDPSSGIEIIQEFTIHNITTVGFANQAWRVKKSYDSDAKREKLTIAGPENQTWLIEIIGSSKQL